jgi:hypothetical protein
VKLRPGQKLHSAVCDTQVIVVRAPSTEVELGCGGAPLLEDGQEPDSGVALDPELSDGPLLGKRYADDDLGLELLCNRAGKGTLTLNGSPLLVKGAKPLPSSD